ncbi:ABC transporter ATP-binding protein [Cellulomonas bogoriensis]|uniref:Multidrug ABC transporter ATPase n=1 Tax=Cellulomonas bogoriensis 69B4 = DSM 16987 TaxID=1386082 RepID=A0A0A0C2E6_9CELL|nr:ABC transporter ATP-binding protein [Cellulomonas bogoriensis]KGM14351.1 multidrug ABC transporter ATPase [Cellulomonas bogoriensis 69B4 = DSM 16987]
MSTQDGVRLEGTSALGAWATLRRGVQLSPQIVQGIWVTLALAVLAAVGRVVVPVAVQQTMDTGILAPDGPRTDRVVLLVVLAAVGLGIAGTSAALVNIRLFRSSEAGLAALRVRAFRHIHDLSALTQSTERRGSLVSRVTSDVDTISLFVQWGGIMLLVSVLQIVVATGLMLVYSWQLTIVVWACFIPLILVLRPAQRRVSDAYAAVRQRVGAMLGAVSEAVVGAETIKAYGVGARTQRRIDAAVRATRDAMVRAQVRVAVVFSSGVLVANLVLSAVVVVGSLMGIDGTLTVGRVLAFLFLVQLFTGPVQMATEILNELQNALAGWRRVIGVVDTRIDVPDAGEDGTRSPRGAATVELQGVSFAYPGGPTVLHDVDLTLPARTKVAVVGATGSGKTTLAKLVTRLVDPARGRVLLDGVDLRDVPRADLRRRVVLVPQEGFLFDGTLLENVAYGIRDGRDGVDGPAARVDGRGAVLDEDRVRSAFADLGLQDWLADLPGGLHADVGQRGESLSAGERQLVALARAHLADGDYLVLDEATSAVDPATEVRIAQALDRLTSGRGTLTIAHRLSTAEASDLVVVVDEGRVVEVGTHTDLVARGGRYATMHGAWVAQTR